MATRIEKRAREVLEFVRKMKDTGANWVQANNAVWGPGGKAMELFPKKADRIAFSKSAAYDEIASVLAEFESPDPVPIGEKAPDQVSGKVLVRMPRTLHASLLAESEREGVSLNQLIVAKLAAHLSALA